MIRTFTDEELERLLDSGESDHVEFKPSWNSTSIKNGSQAVCGFANDFPERGSSGLLLIGVDDTGKPNGYPITNRLLEKIAQLKHNGRISPPPSLLVEKRVLQGTEVAACTVMPSLYPPVRYDGQIWIRVGAASMLATLQDDEILYEKRRLRNERPADLCPIRMASGSDLDRNIFTENFFPKSYEANQQEPLALGQMIMSAREQVPTLTGLLAFGKNPDRFIPGAYIQYTQFDGNEMTCPIAYQKQCHGSIPNLIDGLLAFLYDTGSARKDFKWKYPQDAVREVVQNAILHRDYYGMNTPIFFYQFESRIEIVSPGGPFGRVDWRNLGEAGLMTWRNPNLLQILRILGRAHGVGCGLALAQKAMRDNGNPPIRFQATRAMVQAILPKRTCPAHAKS